MIDFKELKRNKQKLIYLLSDPRDDVLFCYVGQTNSSSRFAAHMTRSVEKQLSDASATAKISWIADLRERCLELLIYPLEICDDSIAHIREWEWIGRAEVSPFHILTNGLIDRAIGAAVVGNQSFPALPGMKPNRLALIEKIVEIYVHFTNRIAPPEGVITGYKLLREKIATVVTADQFDAASRATATEFWKSNLGLINWHILSIGAVGNYIENDVRPDPSMPISVLLTNYVPWSLTQQGTISPEQLRIKSRNEFINGLRNTTQAASASEAHLGKCSLQDFPFTESDLRPPRPSKAPVRTPSREIHTSATGEDWQHFSSNKPHPLGNNMSPSELVLRKFERWSARLDDSSYEVRKEAADVMSTLATEQPMLAEKCVQALQAYIQENRYGHLFAALSAVAFLPVNVIWKNPQLINVVASAPLTEELDAERVGDFFLQLIEGNGLARRKEYLKLVIDRARFALSLGHQGGRVQFMKVIDWAEDHGFDS
ncbi:MAG: hypothetical protein IPN75_09285 [Dechloromonas sp.]|uniref:Uncharacterized protein n=1 Tax=Candidatus Dechloromonas phosphorivorans TaxID=2899244 RepID=A0A9D7LMY4_9RHOO|nr:hypothetical protein [Candidatus Dechloromonas phosphorivorans]